MSDLLLRNICTEMSDDKFCRQIRHSDSTRQRCSPDTLRLAFIPLSRRRGYEDTVDSYTEDDLDSGNKRCDWAQSQELSCNLAKPSDAKRLRPVLPVFDCQRKSTDFVQAASKEENTLRDETFLRGPQNSNDAVLTVNEDGDEYTDLNVNSGKLTLWQFLLELLMSGKYKDLIRWTNKQGEFILLQAENVAKLWGLRKDRNHRMNYDKLSRALRYYYEKNIIRKVHGHKFVYQFIGLQNLLKFCQTSTSSEAAQITNTQVLTHEKEQWSYHSSSAEDQCLSPERRPLSGVGTYTASFAACGAIGQQDELGSSIDPEVSDSAKERASLRSEARCRTSKSNETSNAFVSNGTFGNFSFSTELNSSSPQSSGVAEVVDNSFRPTYFLEKSPSCDSVAIEQLNLLSSLFSSLASVVSLSQLFPTMPTSQGLSTSLAFTVPPNIPSKWVTKSSSEAYSLLEPDSHLEATYSNEQPQTHSSKYFSQIANSDQKECRTSAYGFNCGQPMASKALDLCNLRCETSGDEQATSISPNLVAENRPPSPHCQCSCHRSTYMQSKQISTSSTDLIDEVGTSTSPVSCLHRSFQVTETNKRKDVSPTQLHHQRHVINMQRLGEQISKLGKSEALNTATPFTDETSAPRKSCSRFGEMASSCSEGFASKSPDLQPFFNPKIMDANIPTSDDGRCVWMPVPLTMLTSWLQLLSEIRPAPDDESVTCPVEGHSNYNPASSEDSGLNGLQNKLSGAAQPKLLIVKPELPEESSRG